MATTVISLDNGAEFTLIFESIASSSSSPPSITTSTKVNTFPSASVYIATPSSSSSFSTPSPYTYTYEWNGSIYTGTWSYVASSTTDNYSTLKATKSYDVNQHQADPSSSLDVDSNTLTGPRTVSMYTSNGQVYYTTVELVNSSSAYASSTPAAYYPRHTTPIAIIATCVSLVALLSIVLTGGVCFYLRRKRTRARRLAAFAERRQRREEAKHEALNYGTGNEGLLSEKEGEGYELPAPAVPEKPRGVQGLRLNTAGLLRGKSSSRTTRDHSSTYLTSSPVSIIGEEQTVAYGGSVDEFGSSGHSTGTSGSSKPTTGSRSFDLLLSSNPTTSPADLITPFPLTTAPLPPLPARQQSSSRRQLSIGSASSDLLQEFPTHFSHMRNERISDGTGSINSLTTDDDALAVDGSSLARTLTTESEFSRGMLSGRSESPVAWGTATMSLGPFADYMAYRSVRQGNDVDDEEMRTETGSNFSGRSFPPRTSESAEKFAASSSTSHGNLGSTFGGQQSRYAIPIDSNIINTYQSNPFSDAHSTLPPPRRPRSETGQSERSNTTDPASFFTGDDARSLHLGQHWRSSHSQYSQPRQLTPQPGIPDTRHSSLLLSRSDSVGSSRTSSSTGTETQAHHTYSHMSHGAYSGWTHHLIDSDDSSVDLPLPPPTYMDATGNNRFFN